MSYTALYRRFRPQTFGELVGQEHISRTLAAAVVKGSFVHAYLFCGPRGTGKTSTAKILAKAVNCLEPTPAGEPCGACAACLRSQQGESLDVLEIDAASNRGIDEIRDLRERVKYAPALERYKVYIIDEVHMLTTPAFNALLKTLEEPPAHVIFVLATTEPHKIPLTVLSRCQRFDFRRISDEAVLAHLEAVAQSEGYRYEPEALGLIVRKVEGGMRDALGLLDQCAGFGAGEITASAVMTILGSVNQDFIATLTQRMLSGDLASLLEMVAQLHAEGLDLRQFLHDLLEYQRELLLLKLSPQPARPLPEWAAQAKPAQLVRMLQSLGDADGRLRNSLQPRLTLELALLAACGLEQGSAAVPASAPAAIQPVAQAATPIATQPAPAPTAAAPAAKAKQPAAAKVADPHQAQAPPAAPSPQPPAAPVAEAAPQAAPAESQAEPEDRFEQLRKVCPQILREVAKENITTGSFLQEGKPLALQGDALRLRFPADYELFRDSVCNPGPGRELVSRMIERHYGAKLQLLGELAEPEAEKPESERPPLPEDAPAEQESLF